MIRVKLISITETSLLKCVNFETAHVCEIDTNYIILANGKEIKRDFFMFGYISSLTGIYKLQELEIQNYFVKNIFKKPEGKRKKCKILLFWLYIGCQTYIKGAKIL